MNGNHEKGFKDPWNIDDRYPTWELDGFLYFNPNRYGDGKMKEDQLSVDILSIVAEKDRDRVGILIDLEKGKGRPLPSALFYTALTRLENKGLLSRYMGRSPGMFGGNVDFYSITENGRKVLR